MVAGRLFQLGLCAVVPAGLWALHLKSQQLSLDGANGCSLDDYVSSEISLLSSSAGRQNSCRYALTEGVDFVSFVRRPEKKSPQKLSGERRSHHYRKFRQPKWGDGQGNGSLGEHCFQNCSGAGYCEWCGDGNACCRKGHAQDPEECKEVREWTRGADHHQCVEVPAWTDAKTAGQKNQLVVWVSGYPRSGSSILLSMVSATVDDNRAAGRTFSLFEPCHDGDSYDKWMENKGCRQLLYGVAHCDFKGIKNLWGWRDPHSSNNYTREFEVTAASKLCQDADIVAFKTVDWGHDLSHWQWLMDTHQDMKVLDIVRDPRAIYGSWMTLEPFKSLVESGAFYTLGDICDHFAMNLNFTDSRVHRVVFEDMMKSPKGVAKEVYKFLDQPFSSDQEQWMHRAFNAAECPPPPPGMKGFTDCHTWTGNDPRGDEKWRKILSADDLSYFQNSESCQRVALAYGYTPK